MRPAPIPDADSAFFWEGLRGGRLLLQRCSACARHRFPPMPSCPYCASRSSGIVQAAGRGSIYSWVVVHRAFDPAFAGEVPYTILTVALDEGPKMLGRMTGSAHAAFGGRVKASYADHGAWTELRFSGEA
ncbi:MAG: OB-fold domain-containing protein [Elusimicrobia bacterium]|nr:OB-fold domain-containing protein [Elusimicrobiota bacterium]